MPAFSETKSVPELRQKYDIAPDAFTVLLLSGGHGLVKIDHILEAVADSDIPMTIVSIAGNNERLRKKLAKISLPPHITSRVVGWTDAIDEYMRLSDVVITKPGGVTTSECIALQKPMIIIRPIPGQEECNSDYILESGYGVLARTIADIHYALSQRPDAIAPGYTKAIRSVPAAEQIARTICL
jgi:processive 1,2-diacylglycerol beta-glucosyltransferase